MNAIATPGRIPSVKYAVANDIIVNIKKLNILTNLSFSNCNKFAKKVSIVNTKLVITNSLTLLPV